MDLMKLLPHLYENNNTMQKLQGILSKDIDDLLKNKDIVLNQGFIETSTILLSRYEEIYAIEVDISKNNVFRRERIKAKVRGSGTTTKELIENVASSFANGEVEVIEDYSNYSIKIKFIGIRGIPENMADLILTVEEIKPAHLKLEFIYNYLLWHEFDGFNKTWSQWDDLNITWTELQEFNE